MVKNAEIGEIIERQITTAAIEPWKRDFLNILPTMKDQTED